MNELISIIIPTRNRESILFESLAYLYASPEPFPIEIIVINDGESEISNQSDFENIRFIKNIKQGAASARNYGANLAKGNFLLFMDDDMLVEYKNIKTILRETKSKNNSIFLPNWQYPNELKLNLAKSKFGRFLISSKYDSLEGWINNQSNWNSTEVIKHDGIASYCLLIKKEDFLKCGKYNETIPFAGFEDYDLSEKLMAINYHFYINKNNMIYHNEKDRTTLVNWLERKKRGAFTRRRAYELGYGELKLNYSKTKTIVYKFIGLFSPLILMFSKILPNNQRFDFLYQRISRVLTGYYIFYGYTIYYEKYKN